MRVVIIIILTNVYRTKIANDGTDPLCCMCKKLDESVDHLTASCPILASKEYKAPHDRLGQYIHWNVCKHYNIKVPEKWYEHHPVEVTNGKDVTILWDFTVHTDRTTTANKPDIVIKDLKARTCQIIDMAVPVIVTFRLKSMMNFRNIKTWKLRSPECGI